MTSILCHKTGCERETAFLVERTIILIKVWRDHTYNNTTMRSTERHTNRMWQVDISLMHTGINS